MFTKGNILTGSSLLVAICIIAGAVLYVDNDLPGFKNELPNCLRLRAGNVSLEVRYPDRFINESYNDGIRIKRRDSSDPSKPAMGDYILGVDEQWPAYTPVNEIVKNLDPGPKYMRSNLNGIAVGFAHNASGVNNVPDSDAFGEHYGISDYYEIPFGNRTLSLFFLPSDLSPNEIAGASKMLQSISLQEVPEDIHDARVEFCR